MSSLTTRSENRLKKLRDVTPDIKLELLKKQMMRPSHTTKSEPAWSKRRRVHFMKKAQGGKK
jgi:hypothetical protein